MAQLPYKLALTSAIEDLMLKIWIVTALILSACANGGDNVVKIQANNVQSNGVRVVLSWDGERCSNEGRLLVSVINNSDKEIYLPKLSGVQSAQAVAVKIDTNGYTIRSNQLGILPYSPSYLGDRENIASIGVGRNHVYRIAVGYHGQEPISVISENYRVLQDNGGEISVLLQEMRYSESYGIFSERIFSNTLTC